eukprot:Plantae.Rhodophyta-Hildenbrandia_rubra.ctg17526.p1 GENE.Plantae.Rhodophyta-Hildenbrandia_rubra.ctg17526~~Plantae.Rhodophyta-Hildenbrandia_rubra.ctg17526.p1  ORF type:complete len:326 (-),score=38.00 Plantae.Rhodophyta-Hildenbrandia_rubra.ctg17526:1849-2826(-)
MKLTDLPSPLLGSIAALVSGGEKCGAIAKYQFQVVCTKKEWHNLNPLRSTCRSLRDAAQLAVGGLYCIPIAPICNPSQHGSMPIATVSSLPCLVALDAVYGENVDALMVSLRCLKRVSMLYDFPNQVAETSACRALSVSNSATLQILRLQSVEFHTTLQLLQSLTCNIRELVLNDFPNGVPLLSHDAAMAVTEVELHDCEEIDDVFLQLMHSNKLRKIVVRRCFFSASFTPAMLPSPADLRTLEFGSDSPRARPCVIEKALSLGFLTSIRRFVYCAFSMKDLRIVEGILVEIRNQISHFELHFWGNLTENYAAMIPQFCIAAIVK